MSLATADPYEQLAELAEAAVGLAEQDRVGELREIFARSSALTASLPAMPPRSAQPALERAAAAQEALQARLGDSLREVRAEMDRVSRGRRAARAYGGPTSAAFDLQA